MAFAATPSAQAEPQPTSPKQCRPTGWTPRARHAPAPTRRSSQRSWSQATSPTWRSSWRPMSRATSTEPSSPQTRAGPQHRRATSVSKAISLAAMPTHPQATFAQRATAPSVCLSRRCKSRTADSICGSACGLYSSSPSPRWSRSRSAALRVNLRRQLRTPHGAVHALVTSRNLAANAASLPCQSTEGL